VRQAVRVPPLKDIEIGIQGLAPQFDGYTLLQLTDLHISRLFPALSARAVFERANGLGASLIAVTGDLIDGTLAVRRSDVEPLRDPRAADGVYVIIPGNHEYFFGYRAWMAHFAAMGMHVLDNAHVVIERGGGRLVLAGVTDLSASHSPHPAPDLAAALKGAPEDAAVILLDHQPREARRAAVLGVALQLSGHTHGGMSTHSCQRRSPLEGDLRHRRPPKPIADERRATLSATRPTSSRGFGDFLRSSLLHGAHVEIEQTLALVALFLILLSKFDDLFEDLHIEPFAFGLCKHLLLLLVQLLQFGVQIFDPFDERANFAAGNGDIRHGASLINGNAKMPAKK
jgi:Calcineurin-like phosphoesterase